MNWNQWIVRALNIELLKTLQICSQSSSTFSCWVEAAAFHAGWVGVADLVRGWLVNNAQSNAAKKAGTSQHQSSAFELRSAKQFQQTVHPPKSKPRAWRSWLSATLTLEVMLASTTKARGACPRISRSSAALGQAKLMLKEDAS